MLVRLVNAGCLLGIPALLLALIVGWFDPSAAHHDPIKVYPNGTALMERADRPVDRLEFRYTEEREDGGLYVEFNDGRALRFAPCEYEDSRRCFWDAGTSGNGAGTSFVRYAGRTFRY